MFFQADPLSAWKTCYQKKLEIASQTKLRMEFGNIFWLPA